MVEGEGVRVTLLHTRLSSSPEAALQRAPAQAVILLKGGLCKEISNKVTPPSAGLEQAVCASVLRPLLRESLLRQEGWPKLCMVTQPQHWSLACGTTPYQYAQSFILQPLIDSGAVSSLLDWCLSSLVGFSM